MRFISSFCWIFQLREYPKCHGAGPPEAQGPMQLHRLHQLKAGPASACFHEITELLLEGRTTFLLRVYFKQTTCLHHWMTFFGNCRTVQWIYIAIYTVLSVPCSMATASDNCRVRQFGSDRTRQMISSVVGNFLGGNIFVLANEWISCNTLVLVLFPLVNMLIKQAMSTSWYHIKSKNRQKQY